VVLENAEDYKDANLNNAGWYIAGGSINETYRGMHQWFNDDFAGNLASQIRQELGKAILSPNFGQSNEVGMLADYGYDTARDFSRACTLASMLISLIVAGVFLRSRRTINRMDIAKVAALTMLVPFTVHVIGTFRINNFGGLGGGL
jgi:hypothetical protein